MMVVTEVQVNCV